MNLKAPNKAVSISLGGDHGMLINCLTDSLRQNLSVYSSINTYMPDNKLSEAAVRLIRIQTRRTLWAVVAVFGITNLGAFAAMYFSLMYKASDTAKAAVEEAAKEKATEITDRFKRIENDALELLSNVRIRYVEARESFAVIQERSTAIHERAEKLAADVANAERELKSLQAIIQNQSCPKRLESDERVLE